MATRPLYDRFAWAYDLVVDRPAGPTAEQVAALLAARAVRAGSLVVDAGCGTGRHAAPVQRARRASRYVPLVPPRAARPVLPSVPGPRGAADAAPEFVYGDLLAWRPSEAVHENRLLIVASAH